MTFISKHQSMGEVLICISILNVSKQKHREFKWREDSLSLSLGSVSLVIIGSLLIAFHKLMVGAELCKLMHEWSNISLTRRGRYEDITKYICSLNFMGFSGSCEIWARSEWGLRLRDYIEKTGMSIYWALTMYQTARWALDKSDRSFLIATLGKSALFHFIDLKQRGETSQGCLARKCWSWEALRTRSHRLEHQV